VNKSFRSGKVKLHLVVDPEGNARNIKVSKKLSPELDQKAVEIVQKWKFDPARRKGQPVAAEIQVEVNFNEWEK
jgi:TonB family protein